MSDQISRLVKKVKIKTEVSGTSLFVSRISCICRQLLKCFWKRGVLDVFFMSFDRIYEMDFISMFVSSKGNVKFIPDETHHEQARVEGSDILGTIAKLLASSQDEVEKVLLYRVVAARGEVVEKGHSVKEAMYGRDAFAKVCHIVVTFM